MVLSPAEVKSILQEIPVGPMRLMAGLQYGAGLRLMESCRLRIKDVDFERKQVIVREGKGAKDRYVPLPEKLSDGLQRQVRSAKAALGDELPMQPICGSQAD